MKCSKVLLSEVRTAHAYRQVAFQQLL